MAPLDPNVVEQRPSYCKGIFPETAVGSEAGRHPEAHDATSGDGYGKQGEMTVKGLLQGGTVIDNDVIGVKGGFCQVVTIVTTEDADFVLIVLIGKGSAKDQFALLIHDTPPPLILICVFAYVQRAGHPRKRELRI
jgi:hypothetical protein